MEARAWIIIFLFCFIVSTLYSLVKGLDFGSAALSGAFIGSIAVIIIYFGKRKIYE